MTIFLQGSLYSLEESLIFQIHMTHCVASELLRLARERRDFLYNLIEHIFLRQHGVRNINELC